MSGRPGSSSSRPSRGRGSSTNPSNFSPSPPQSSASYPRQEGSIPSHSLPPSINPIPHVRPYSMVAQQNPPRPVNKKPNTYQQYPNQQNYSMPYQHQGFPNQNRNFKQHGNPSNIPISNINMGDIANPNSNSTYGTVPTFVDENTNGEPLQGPMYERMLFAVASLVGQKVNVGTIDGNVIEGIFHTAKMDSKTFSIVLKMAKTKNSQNQSANNPRTILISSQDFMYMEAHKIDMITSEKTSYSLSYVQNSPFMIDTAISGNGPVRERELVAWVPENLHSQVTYELEKSSKSEKWDQFEVNKKLFGVHATFEEESYTTKIDKSSEDYKKKEQRAEIIAAEIMASSSSSGNIHLLEERGQLAQTEDEEQLYGSVARDPQKIPKPDPSQPSKRSLPATILNSDASALPTTYSEEISKDFDRFSKKEKQKISNSKQFLRQEVNSKLKDFGNNLKLKSTENIDAGKLPSNVPLTTNPVTSMTPDTSPVQTPIVLPLPQSPTILPLPQTSAKHQLTQQQTSPSSKSLNPNAKVYTPMTFMEKSDFVLAEKRNQRLKRSTFHQICFNSFSFANIPSQYFWSLESSTTYKDANAQNQLPFYPLDYGLNMYGMAPFNDYGASFYPPMYLPYYPQTRGQGRN